MKKHGGRHKCLNHSLLIKYNYTQTHTLTCSCDGIYLLIPFGNRPTHTSVSQSAACSNPRTSCSQCLPNQRESDLHQVVWGSESDSRGGSRGRFLTGSLQDYAKTTGSIPMERCGRMWDVSGEELITFWCRCRKLFPLSVGEREQFSTFSPFSQIIIGDCWWKRAGVFRELIFMSVWNPYLVQIQIKIWISWIELLFHKEPVGPWWRFMSFSCSLFFYTFNTKKWKSYIQTISFQTC